MFDFDEFKLKKKNTSTGENCCLGVKQQSLTHSFTVRLKIIKPPITYQHDI